MGERRKNFKREESSKSKGLHIGALISKDTHKKNGFLSGRATKVPLPLDLSGSTFYSLGNGLKWIEKE